MRFWKIITTQPRGIQAREPSTFSFSNLPNELLIKILCEVDEPKARRRLLELRSLSKSANDIVKSRAVEYARIPKNAVQVEEMLAMSPNTFETSTRTLLLDVQNYDEAQSGEWKALAALVRKMKGVQAVRVVLRGPLNGNLVDALSSLPQLASLEIVCLRESPANTLRLSSHILANLKSLSLKLKYLLDPANRGETGIDDIKDIIVYLIRNAPLLEDLTIEPTISRLLDLEAIATPQGPKTSRLPLLKSIAAPAMTFPTSPNAVNLFARLISLQVPNTLGNDPPLWPALRAARVSLRIIKVECLSAPLINYLLGYRGMQTFHLGGLAVDDPTTSRRARQGSEVLKQLLSSGLVEHRATLRDVSFRASRDASAGFFNWDGGYFCFSSDVLRSSHRFRALERLDFVVQAKSAKEKMHQILTTLPALSIRLRLVCFTVVGIAGSMYTNRKLGYWDIPGSILQALEEIRCTMCPINWKMLRVVTKTFDPHRTYITGFPSGVTRVVYRVEKLEGTDPDSSLSAYGFRIDPSGTEILSEESARSKDEDIIL